MKRFILRAHHHNMTNGEFALFTFWPQKTSITDFPWFYYGGKDAARIRPAFQAIKQVRARSIIADNPRDACARILRFPYIRRLLHAKIEVNDYLCVSKIGDRGEPNIRRHMTSTDLEQCNKIQRLSW